MTRRQMRESMTDMPAAVAVLCCLLALPLLCSLSSASVLLDSSAAGVALLEDANFVEAELFPKEPRVGSTILVEEWSHYILGMSGLLAVKSHLGDPNDHPHFLAPDQRSTPSYGGYDTQTSYDYEWQRIGKVRPNDLTPFTEGYRPPLHGYFQQSAECDQFLRMWSDQCAFKDEGSNVYHSGPKNFFENGADGERQSASTYLKGVMEKWEKQSDMYLSAQRFGGQPKTETEEAPTDIDEQKAPPN